MTIAKAVTALVVVFVSLIVGREAAEGLDVTAPDAAIVSILTAIGVYAVPNAAEKRIR